MRIQFAMPHKRDQLLRPLHREIEVLMRLIRIYIMPIYLQMRLARLGECPRRRRDHRFGSVGPEVAKESTLEETDICALSADVEPLLATETADAGPVVGLQFAHTVEDDVERDSKELVSENHVWVGFCES